MIWVILTALAAVCGAAKLDTNYLAPISARTAGGSAGALLAPFDGNLGLPTGGYTNDAQGVVVDAVNPGTRTSGLEPTGLGGPRTSYGSKDSKVGDAAFGVFGSINPGLTRIAPGFGSFVESDEPQADKTSGNSLKFTSDVGLDNYSYGFDTDNGISVGENGEAAGGVKAQGGYSYKGDDGKKYSVSYTADKGGYKPQGQHLPTPPPIPNEILISLEKNAKEEAAGHVDNGSYTAQKYNDAGDYSSNDAGNNNGRPTIGGGDATPSGSYVSQSGQRPTSGILLGSYTPGSVGSLSLQGHGHLNQQQAVSSRFGEGQQTTFASSTQKPFISQQQGSDDSYHYKKPSKPFTTPTVIPSGQYSIHHQPNVPVSSISQQVSKYPNTPATVATGQYQGTSSSNYNGITQASISPFPSGSSSSSSQFASQSSQFGSKPSTQFGQTSQPTSTQFGSTETHSGHKVQGQTQFAQSGLQTPTQFGSTETHSGHQTQSQAQFGQSSTSQTSDSSKSPTQQYQGTIYQYNKPATTLSGNKVQGQTQFGQSGQQTSTQFGSTETHSGHKVEGQTQFVQSGLQVPTQSGSTETHSGHQTSQTSDSSHSPTQQYHGTIYQYNKPATILPAQGHKDTSSFAQATVTSGKPGQVETDSRFGTQQSSSQFGSQSTSQQTQTGSNVQPSQFGQKPIVGSQVSGSKYQFGSSGSQFVQKPVTTQGSSFTYSQSQSSQYGKKPVVSTIQTGSQFGSGSQFGQNSQSTVGTGSVSTTAKPFGSSNQQTQFGSTSFQFGQNSQSSHGSGVVSATAKPFGSSYQQTQFGSKPSTTQGSGYTYTQSQTSQYGKKPVVSTTQTGTQFGSGSQFGQNSQFGSSSSQFGQNSQSTFGSGSVSSTAKPIGSSYQQTGSQFGQNVQSSSGAGAVSTTVKPAFGSSYQQTQFGSKPSTSQGSSFTYTQSQTSQYGKKPVVSTTQTGSQFGSGSQFGQNSQSTIGTGSVSTTAKPFGSSNQQTQFGSTGFQFGQNSQSSQGAGVISTTAKPFGSSYQQTQFGSKPSTTQGSGYTYTQSQTSQYGKKPIVSTTQTGLQFGSGSQFGQNSQSTIGTGSVSTTAKPFGSSNQQTQFGSTGFQFGQNSQSSQGSGVVSTTAKPFGSSYQQTQFGSKPSTTQGSGYTYTQSQTSQYGKKPVVSTTQTGSQFGSGSQFGQNSQFGSSVTQFGQNSQSTFGSGSVSSTAKPIGSSYQQTGSQFGQNVQSSSGAGAVSTTVKPAFGSSYQQTQFGSKPSTTQGSGYTYTQSQTSQYGKKPVVSTTQTGTQFGSGSQFGQNSQFGSSGSQLGQNSQFGSSGSQFVQNSQSTFGSGSVSSTAKPIGSSYQLTGSQFGQNVQSSSGAGAVSTTVKPAFGSSYQQTQFGSKPSTTLGSSFTYTQSQTSQYGKKPVVSTTQTGTQFGSGSQFGQNSQSTQGSAIALTTSKPVVGIKPVYQQAQFGSSGSQFGQNSQLSQGFGSVSTTAKPAFGQASFGSSSQNSQFGSTGSQFVQKPLSTIQGSSYSSNKGSTGEAVQTTQFGVAGSSQSTGSQGAQHGSGSDNKISGAGAVSTTVKPAFGSSYQQTQFGSKPSTSQGSSFTYTQSQISQYGKKPVVSTTQTGSQFGSGSQFGQNSQSTVGTGSVSTTAKPFGSSNQQTQFGSTGFQFSQNSQSSQGSSVVATTAKPFGSSYQQTQFGSKPSTTQGSGYTYTQSQTSQYGKKPVVSTTQTGSQFGSGSQFGQNSQFGSSVSQFGQNSQSTFGSGSISSTAKPIGSSYQQTGSQFGQNVQSSSGAGAVSTTVKPAFGSSYQQTQFGSKPSTTQGSGYTYTQSQTSQYGKKPVVSTTQTGSQFGSGSQFGQNSQFGSSGSQFGQNSQSTFGSGSVSSTAKPIGSSYQQTGSQFGQNVQSSSGAGAVSTTVKPAFGSSYQQTQFGSKPSTTQGSGYTYTQSQTSQYGKKPVVSTTQTGAQFGSGSQFGQNSQFGSSGSQLGQNSQFGSSGSQFVQNSQSTFGSGSVSSTAKPIGSSYQQTGSQFGQNVQSSSGAGAVSTTVKPAFGSSYQQTQFGSKPSTTQGSSFTYTQSQTSQYGKKPVVSTTQTGTQFGSGSQFGQNSQSTQGSAIALTTSKPVVGIKPVYQQAQFGSSGSQFGQNSQLSQGFGSVSTTAKPAFGQASFGSSSQNSQFGSTGSQFVQKPLSTIQGSSYSSNKGSTGEAVQTTQFGVAGSSQSTGSQGAQHGSGSDNKISGSSFTSGSSFQQTQFAGTSGSQIGQTTQHGIKPIGSAQATQGSTQFGSTPSRFGESSQTIVPISTISQIVEPTQFVQKPLPTPFGSSTTHFGQKPHAHALASSTGSNVVPFSSTQTGQVSKYESSKFGVQNQGVVSSTQKPVGSSLTQTNYQQYQYTQNSDKSGSQSQFGQGSQSNVGSGQIGQNTFGVQAQKPFGSTQSTYQQTQFTQGQKPFGSSQGSAFQIGGQSIGDQPSQGTVQTASVAGYNYQKPQSVFTTQFGSQSNGAQDQKVQQSQTNYNSAVSTVQTPINGQTFKPFGVPSTQGTFQQSQSTVGSSLFGAQAVKPTDFSGPVIQTSYNKFSGKPFQPASTVSTQGSNVQSQSSAVSTSQSGLQPTPSTELAHFSGRPEHSIIPSIGVELNPSVFSGTQVPSGIGSNDGNVVSTVQTPIVPIPGYELVINQGTSTNQGLSHSFVGLGEQFGGPRDPPRFDDKTGYHY